jgi:lipopolysaccharide assembly outer membrane protein LptD (OstA)
MISRTIRVTALAAMLLVLGLAGATRLGAAGKVSKLDISYERMHINMQQEKLTVSTLYGGKAPVKIVHDDAVFTAAQIVVRSEGKVHELTCTGTPAFTDPETRITGDTVVGYTSPRRAEFTGNVKMVSTPKKKTKDGRDAKTGDIKSKIQEPTTLTSDAMSYDYANKYGIAKGNVVVAQKHRTVWADEGYYDQQMEKIELKGNVRVKNTGSEELKEIKDAGIVTISLVDNWIDIQANPGGVTTMIMEVEDDQPAKDGDKPKDDEKPKEQEKK